MTTPNNPASNSAGQWGNPQPGHQPNPSQWGAQPNQPQGQPQWGAQPGQPQGQPQWGAQPGQPQGQPQWGAQPNQPGQPHWGAQPGQPDGTMQAPKVTPVWPTWAMLGFFLLSFLTSFMTVSRTIVDLDDFEGLGSIGGTLNWWGAFSVESSGLGRLGEAALKEEVTGTFLIGIGTVLTLGCYIAATVLYFLGKEKLGAILGIIGAGLQLSGILFFFFSSIGDDYTSLGAGWWMWLLFGILALALSIFLLVKGRSGIEGQFAKAKNSVQQVQQRNAQQQFQQQSQQGQQGFQQPGQPGQGFQQPGQPGQGFQQPQPYGQPAQQPQQGFQQPYQQDQQGFQPPQQSNQQSGSTSYRVEPSSTASTTDASSSGTASSDVPSSGGQSTWGDTSGGTSAGTSTGPSPETDSSTGTEENPR
ncbi:hypothetical protein KBX19_10050 [Corynebacterium sp. CCUG 71335]|uniref:hypothetical protein n=1 Tax=Corynebacterium sp. CCUG 71335 TaxID=2823892 RepID=UPI00210AC0F7|nr:hypothetical protein [Corynebacterium sp. CCUG 71335]MCQ4621553.1 hypothetical protein [Corynebacterium sp. CCUG 71335]